MPYVGEIRMFACNFAPNGWSTCDGELLPVRRNEALFNVLGFIFGGNGSTTFALPDLGGAAAVCYGTGNDLAPVAFGEDGGAAEVLITQATMATHSHKPGAMNNGKLKAAAGATWAERSTVKPPPSLYANFMSGKPIAMASGLLAPVGGGTLHNNLMPYLGVNFCISLEGVNPNGENE